MPCKPRWFCQLIGGMPLPEPGCSMELKNEGVDVLISLIEEGEFYGSGWRDVWEFIDEMKLAGIVVIRYPIPDFRGPRSEESLFKLLDRVAKLASMGLRIVFHCYGGTGRTAMMLAALLIACGRTMEEAIEEVRRRYGVIDLTLEQEMFLKSFELGYRGKLQESRHGSYLCSVCA